MPKQKKPANDAIEKVSGKNLLVDAALELAASRRCIHSLSVREISREAGLNHNTFYRHFDNIEALGLYIIEDIAAQLRQPLIDLRYLAYKQTDSELVNTKNVDEYDALLHRAINMTKMTVTLFFDFVETNPNAFIFGVRELHGPSAVLRGAIQQFLQDFSDDMSHDIQALELLPQLDKTMIDEISQMIIPHLFQQSLDYIEHRHKRNVIRETAQRHIQFLYAGAATLADI